MSLFKTRDIWSASCENDLFDLGCLKVSNLGCNKKNHNSIVTGSYNGFLRIYNPTIKKDFKSTDDDSLFKAHDLSCEISFPGPIIQIETGRFVSTSKKQHIAVLMPKKLAVYEVNAYEGNEEHGHQYNLKFIYEHVLDRIAFNMCKGSFGGLTSINNTDPHEYICVQSVDGMLSIFEYESHSLSCFLPKVLIPGPFKYVSKTDSFITVSSSWELESYRYQTLATSAKTYERHSSEAGSTNTKQKRIKAEYTFNLGESALDIEVYNQSQNTCLILVLGERNLFCFSDTCVLKFMKKFDYNPSSFCVYPILNQNGQINTQTNAINFIISTHSKLLYVHEDVKVKWAAQLNYVPVQMCVARINDMNGIIVSLSEDGKLKCSYLGTEPAFLNPLFKEDASRGFNIETAEKEYRNLQSQIKNAIMNTGAVIKATSKTGLIMSVEVPNQLDKLSNFNRNLDTELKDPLDAIPSITCKLSLKCAEGAQNVKVVVNTKLPIVCIPDTITYSSISSVPFEQDLCFYMKTKHIPSSLEVIVCASFCYIANGSPRVSETRFRLPLKLIMKSGEQSSKVDSDSKQKDSKLNNVKKITIETNKQCVNLTELFPELSSSYTSANGNVLAAQYYGHANMNILIQGSKSGSNRYRLQSDNYESLWIITKEFVTRLNSFYEKQSQSVEMVYQESLPTEDFRQVIDKHLEIRQTIDRYKETLEKCCTQFRAIQKRMLIKFKDKSPTSLDNMDALLEATYRQIVSISDTLLLSQAELGIVTNSLNCISSLYVLLVSLAFKFSKEGLEMLEAAMTSQVGDTSELGWEETVNAAVASMIRTYSKNSVKDSQLQNNQQLKIPVDSTKLEKQLKSFISKLESGASLLPSITASLNSSSNKTSPEPKPKEPEKQNVEPQSVKKIQPPVAARNKYTMGEDYDYFDTSSNQQKQDQTEPERKPFGSKKLPTFEELMAEELKNKNESNYELDDD